MNLKGKIYFVDEHNGHPLIRTNGPIQTLVSTGNGPVPSSSPSSSSSSSISSSGKSSNLSFVYLFFCIISYRYR
jgi:hypothetical protein